MGEEVRSEKINDIGNIEVPTDGPVVLSAVLNINIKELDWDDSFADEDNIMFQILKGEEISLIIDDFWQVQIQFIHFLTQFD